MSRNQVTLESTLNSAELPLPKIQEKVAVVNRWLIGVPIWLAELPVFGGYWNFVSWVDFH
jgi:hypothetical protein